MPDYVLNLPFILIQINNNFLHIVNMEKVDYFVTQNILYGIKKNFK